MLENIKAVFFDAGGTLLYPYPSVGEIYARVASKYGSQTPPEELNQVFGEVWSKHDGLSQLEGHYDEAAEKKWWHDIVHEVFEQVGQIEDFEGYFDELYELFATPEAWRLYPETIEVLKAVREKVPCVGIVSNWDSRLYKLCDDFQITPHVDFILASAVFGAAKPSPLIFEEALRLSKIPAEQTIHIGDSLSDDIVGAKRLGIRNVLISRSVKRTLTDAQTTPDYHIHDLRELLS